MGDASEASRCVIRRQRGLEPALGGGRRGPLQPRRRPAVRQEPTASARPRGSGQPAQRDPARCEKGPHGRGQKEETRAGPRHPEIALSPEGASFPRGFPYVGASAAAEGRVRTNKVSAHMMVILHACVCGGRLHVATLLEVWPSPVPRDTDASSPLRG